MTTWGDLEVGSRVKHEGSEHVVRVLKRGGLSVRAVLEPCAEGVVAKVAVRARLTDKVKLAKGAKSPDRPGSAIKSVLGGVQVAKMKLDSDEGIFICAAPNVTTIASHLRIMHGVELQGLPVSGEAELLRVHDELHAAPFHEPSHAHRHKQPKGEKSA